MSTVVTTPPPPVEAPLESRSRHRRTALLILAGFVLLCLVRVISGADELTSSGTLTVTLTATMPIAMCGLGGLWSERAGVVNIGLEGMMIMGTLGAGLLRLPLRRLGRRAGRHPVRRCSAARCTRWPPSSSASTTSSPVWPST